MKVLSRADLEAIGERVIRAYAALPGVAGQVLERVDIDHLCHDLLGLQIDYRHLSKDGVKLGLTSFCKIGVEVFPEDGEPEYSEDQFYMLDGKTLLIESELAREGANVGRRNYTVSHESCHHILKLLFPRDYGAQTMERCVHYCYRTRTCARDWEEWQVDTLAGIILLPAGCVQQCMERFGLGSQMRLLNRVFARSDYRRFEEMANYMGVSKTALSIRKRVAAYCRVSTDSEEQLVSYANQKKVYTEMIGSRKDWCFAGLFADEGISGTRADKRPEFNKMINACLAGKIDYIITKSVSRFARNTVDCLDYVRMLKSKGIGVYFEEQQIDTLKTDSELYLVIYAGFAQSESESISKNIIWTVRNKFEEGIPVFMYKRFLGYRKGADGEPEIVPSEAAIVERIFNLYLAGETVDNISKMMQAEHPQIPGKNISFSKGMIMSMLANERYCGDAILQKSVTVDCIEKKRKKNTGEAPMYYVQNSHPAIIDRVTFNKVQEELARRRAKSPASTKTAITSTGKYSRYALTDVLICGECGTRYRRVTWSRNGVKRIVWRCISRLDYGKKYCKESPTVFEDKLKEAIVRAVNKFNDQDNATYKALMRATIGEALGLNGDPEEVDMLERKIEALNNKMLALVNESVASGEGIETHESEFMSLSQELELLKQRIATIQESAATDSGNQDRLEQIQAIIAEREHNRTEYDDSIVRQMVECIKVYPGGRLEIIFGGGYLVEEAV